MAEPFLLRFMQPLLAGRRAECFDLVQTALAAGTPAESLICDVVWPAMGQIDRLYRDDRINTAVEHMATRITRTIADQLQAALPKKPPNAKRVLITSADTENEELGAQMVADLFQADGWEVFFIGGGVPADEVLTMVGQLRPTLMLIFGTEPDFVPEVRRLVELIREVGTCPSMNIIVSGGIFNRADGLWQEVGADVCCATAREALQVASELGPRAACPPRLGLVKRRRRRRKGTATPELVAVGAE